MNLSKPIKIIIGLATGAYSLFPLIFIPVWLIAVISAATGVNYRGDPPPMFFVMIFSMFPLICLFNVLHFVMVPVYLIHIIKNDAGSDIYRILAGIGLFALPWLAMPIYFFVYIWPEYPPSWALEAPGSPSISPASEAAMNKETVEPQIENEEVTFESTIAKESEPDSPPEAAAMAHQAVLAEEVVPMSEADAEEPPAASDATMIHPALKASPEEAPKEEEKPAKKPRRKRAEKASAEELRTNQIAPGEPEPPSDATIIGPSPIPGEPSDKA